jgi:hypothetical protein
MNWEKTRWLRCDLGREQRSSQSSDLNCPTTLPQLCVSSLEAVTLVVLLNTSTGKVFQAMQSATEDDGKHENFPDHVFDFCSEVVPNRFTATTPTSKDFDM